MNVDEDNPYQKQLQENKLLLHDINELRFERAGLKDQIDLHVKTIREQRTKIEELEEAIKKTSFVTASKVGTESQVSVDNAKYRTLLQVMSIPITITETGDYVIYSDPVKKVLEIRKAAPKP